MSGKHDTAKYVRKKIADDEICEFCIEGVVVADSVVKTRKYISLIERQGDHALFIFSSRSIPCLSETDLRLEQVFPVDADLRLVSEPPQKDTAAKQGTYLLWVQVKEKKFVFEINPESDAKKFVAELQKAKAIQSQNAGFALPSTFGWLEKYREQTVAPSTITSTMTSTDDSNPFATDVFDPLKHMSLHNTSNSRTSKKAPSGFEDDFSTMNPATISNNIANVRKSRSRDSLDDILDSDLANNFTESLDKVAERELGLKPGVSMAAGLKPLTARETLVEYLLKQRQKEYVDLETYRVFVGTWNVNGQNTTNLAEWLACDKDPPDIYAVGFQELDTSNQAYIFSDSARETEWQEAVHKHLHPKARYQKVKSIRLVGVLLIVYVKEMHAGHVKYIDTDNVPTGIMGMLGNKGGVGVRFSLHDTTLCFINSHLAAHQDEFERRNQDTHDIETKMKFRQFLPPLTVTDHDFVFWLGDLNYRIDLDISEVKDYVTQGALNKLLAHDQLTRQLKTNSVYKTYSEGEINFQPTYKYDPGTDSFDSSEKSRIPAWCDRILWKGSGARQIIYRSHPTLRISDHKPVSALFDAGIKVVERTRYKKVYEDIMKKLDRLENDYLPQVTLAQKEFEFKDVKFNQPREQILAIANIGQVPVTFEFIVKLEEDSYCKPWLKVNPYKAVIPPGDSCEISLEVMVDKTIAYRFNCGHEKIEDILVLHLHGGKDFFIPITGNYMVSSFGSSVEALVQMHGPIREVPTDQLIDLERPGSLDNVDILADGVRLYACPKEIFRLVDHIWQYGRHQEDLFCQPGLNTEIHQIRDCLDTGKPDMLHSNVFLRLLQQKTFENIVAFQHEVYISVSTGSIHSVTEALVLFLESLAEPVMPYCLYETCLDCANNFLLCKQVVSTVPDCHRNVFKYLCAFLRQLLEESKFNNLEIKYLAQMFGDVFLRPPPLRLSQLSRNMRRQHGRSEDIKKSAFLYHFLAHEYDE